MSDILKLLKMGYEQCCDYLINKYGQCPKNYFTNENCKYPTQSIKRAKSDGLFIHHIDEDKAIMLSSPSYAIKNPFCYQHASRLVYCNFLEHLVLHIKIIQYPNKDRNKNENVGVGGIFNFIIPELNDIYSGIKYKAIHKIKPAEVVLNTLDEYMICLEYLMINFKLFPLELYLKSFNISFGGWKHENNYSIYERIVELFKKINNINQEIDWKSKILKPLQAEIYLEFIMHNNPDIKK